MHLSAGGRGQALGIQRACGGRLQPPIDAQRRVDLHRAQRDLLAQEGAAQLARRAALAAPDIHDFGLHQRALPHRQQAAGIGIGDRVAQRAVSARGGIIIGQRAHARRAVAYPYAQPPGAAAFIIARSEQQVVFLPAARYAQRQRLPLGGVDGLGQHGAFQQRHAVDG